MYRFDLLKRIKGGYKVTRDDIVELLDDHIRANAQHWGDDSFWTRQARGHKDRVLSAYDTGADPVGVAALDWYHEDGCDYEDWLLTDGSISRYVYGAS